MSENDPAAEVPSRPEETAGTFPPSDPETSNGTQASFRAKLRLALLRAAAMLGAFLLLMMMLTGFAGVYTSRPEFCRSCHNMEPYYVSWKNSSHKDVSCIKCHFPPGAGEKVRGKMLGLVQLAKYVTASASSRPTAEIPDASCLRMGCHDTRTLSGRVDFHGIPFDHQPHLEEVRRGKQLRCTSCHSQIVQGKHMSVTTSTCFLCHFKNGLFNEGLGACTRCHQIPDKKFDLGGGVIFHHDLAYEKGVDCENCHSDLIRGNGSVPHERCQVCHNREKDLKRIDDHQFIHEKHVSEHKVDCLDCHLEIKHSLDPEKILHAAANCTSCHPDHHREQVNMLQGLGGKSIPSHASSMIVARIACPSCHRVKEASRTGTVLWKASTAMCNECHDASKAEEYQLYNETLRAALSNIESAVQSVRKALESATLEAKRTVTMESQLSDVQDDLNFLRAANGIHNIHYANTLTRALVQRLSAMSEELGIEKPQVTLPKASESLK